MSEVEITTDGSCLGNPGPGGWACILRCGQHERVLQGGVADTTNNRMELIAAIEGLRALKRASQVTVLTDSEYVRRESPNSFRGGRPTAGAPPLESRW